MSLLEIWHFPLCVKRTVTILHVNIVSILPCSRHPKWNHYEMIITVRNLSLTTGFAVSDSIHIEWNLGRAASSSSSSSLYINSQTCHQPVSHPPEVTGCQLLLSHHRTVKSFVSTLCLWRGWFTRRWSVFFLLFFSSLSSQTPWTAVGRNDEMISPEWNILRKKETYKKSR